MVITFEDAQEYLSSMGVEIPAIILRAIVAKINKLEPCFLGGEYSEEDIALLGAYLVGLLGLMSGQDGRIRSQSAASGASQSFFFADINERYKSYTSLIYGLDPNGCAASIIPPNPAGASCALFISPGVCS